MIKKILIVLAVFFAFFSFPSAFAYTWAENCQLEDYTRWATVVNSYLYPGDDGNLIMVANGNGAVIVRVYNPSFQEISSNSIPSELELFGGFFAGESYNFLVFGQTNPQESNDTEVIRVVKYSKSWERMGDASLYGINTRVPFEFGSLRFAEAKGMLYLRTSHVMYADSAGLNHQANLIINVRQSDMAVTVSYSSISHDYGYVSHSFNQFIIADKDGNLVALDHGDAYPRAAALFLYPNAAGRETLPVPRALRLVSFPGSEGNNVTGAAFGGLEESANGYLVAGNLDQSGQLSAYRSIVVAAVGKDLKTSALITLSDAHEGEQRFSAPHLVKITDNRFLVVWEVLESQSLYIQRQTGELNYVYVDGSGQPLSEVFSAQGILSDCKPILYRGKVTWYVTNFSMPRFFTLDESGVTSAYPYDTIFHVDEFPDNNYMFEDGEGVIYSSAFISVDRKPAFYTGQPIVKRVEGVGRKPWMIRGIDFTVAYSNNVYPGTAAITITGVGRCDGSYTQTFTIQKRPLAGAKITLFADSFSYSGSPITPTVVSVSADGVEVPGNVMKVLKFQRQCDRMAYHKEG